MDRCTDAIQRSRRCVGALLCLALLSPKPLLRAQEQNSAPKYKITVLTDAATMKRGKKGRISSQAVVKVTDENDTPVAGIAVTFTIPQFVGGGASFANGALTSMVTTNAAGVASSSVAAASGTSFTVGVSATVPGGVITASVPVNTAAAAAAAGGSSGTAAGSTAGTGGGLSTGAVVGIVAGVAAAAAVGIGVGVMGGGGKSTPAVTTPTSPRGTITGPGGPVFGPPR